MSNESEISDQMSEVRSDLRPLSSDLPLIACLEKLITLRDEIWLAVASNPAAPSQRDASLLQLCNYSVSIVLDLPALSPERTRFESLRVKICTTFGARLAIEIHAAKKHEGNAAAISAAQNFLAANDSLVGQGDKYCKTCGSKPCICEAIETDGRGGIPERRTDAGGTLASTADAQEAA